MSETLLDSVRLDVISPKTPLLGLNDALTKLKALGAALDAVNGRLAGLNTLSAFKRTKAELAEILRGFSEGTRRIVPIKSVPNALGIPDQKDFDQFISSFRARNKGKLKDIFASEQVAGKGGVMERIYGFASADKAAAVAQQYFNRALKNTKDPVAMLQSLFGAGGSGGAASIHTVASTPVPLTIPAAQIQAVLGPGIITLNVPAGQVQGYATGGGGGAGGHAGGGGGTGGGGSGGGTPGAPGGSGALLEERITTGEGKSTRVQRRELIRAGETVDKFFKDVNGALEPVKEVSTKSPFRRAQAKLQDRTAALKAELEQELALPAGRRDPVKLAAIYRKQAAAMNDLMGTEQNPTGVASELSKLGKGALVSRTRANAAKIEQKAAQMEERAIEQQQAQYVADFQQTARLRKELDAAKQRGEKEEAQRIKAEKTALERRMADTNRMLAARGKSDEQAQSARRKVAEHDLRTSQAAAYRQATYQAGQAAMTDFLSSGGRLVSERQGLPGAPRRLVAEREAGGQKETLTVTYGKAGAEIQRLTKSLSEARKEGGYLAGDFVKNTAKVTLWAASVGVLYKSLELVTHSISQLVEIGPQLGRLEQVFKGVGGTAQQLAIDTLELAAINGASTKEAMEAAIQWSRLGLTRVEVNEAVRVSLMAANVAQIDALDATEKLQGVMQAYKLRVGELRGELGQIVAISNTYNVTTNDMLTGLSRVAAVAKQAGLPLAELQGLLGATIGGTAQSGANIGNMMKSVILALSNPDLQNKLRTQFKFEPTTGAEEIKGMSQLLSDLFVKYQHLNQLQRQSLLFSVGGRTQSSRLEAMLEGYVKAQVLAVNAQLHLNTAEQENAKITASLKIQLHGLVAEWERFVFIQGNRGPVQAMTQMSTAMRNLLTIVNTPVGSTVTTGVLGLLAAGGMKSILTGMSLGGNSGFLGRSGAHMKSALAGFNNSLGSVFTATLAGGSPAGPSLFGMPGRNVFNPIGPELFTIDRKLYTWSEAMLRVGRSSMVTSSAVRGMATALGTVTRALGVGFIALRQWIGPLAVIGASVYVFNQAMERMGLSSEKAQRKLAGFNEEAERAAAAASAYAEASQALNTIQRALTPENGFQVMGLEDQKKYIGQSADLVGLYEPDLNKQQALQKQFRDQAEALRAQGNIAGVINLLEKERNQLAGKRREELQKQFTSITQQQRALDSELKRLNELQNGSVTGQFFRGSRADRITELEKQRSELGSNKTRNILEQTDAYEEQVKYDQKYQSAIRTEKLLWESIAQVYASVNANNPMERAHLNIASLEAQNRAIENHVKLLEEEDQADVSGQAAKEEKLKDLRAQEQQLRSEMMELTHPKQTITRAAIVDEAAVAKKQSQLDVLEQQQKDLGSNIFPGPEGLGFARRQLLRSQDTEELKSNRAQIEAQQRNLSIVDFQTRVQFGREEGRRETAPSEFGFDETQKLLNKRQGIQRILGDLVGQAQTPDVISRELELQNQKYEAQIALRTRSFNVEKDIRQLIMDQRRELEHSILGAGPGEMLRKMAAIRMGEGGRMNIGQFLSLSPEMRRDVAMVDPRFDPRMIDLQRERNRQTRSGPDEFRTEQLKISADIAKLGTELGKVMPQRATYDAAKEGIDRLGLSAGSAAAQLDALSLGLGKVQAVLDTILGKGNAPEVAGTAPRNPQAGGVGAGIGFRGHGAGGEF